MKILVVDDDDSVLQLLERTLTYSGKIEVAAVASASAALDEIAASQTPFDCMLVDIQMPEVDGITLTRMVRQTPGYGDTAIVMLTAMQDKGYLDAAFSAGATDYVTKPFDFVDLRQRIQDAYLTSRRKKDLQDFAHAEGELKKMGGEAKDFRLEDPVALRGAGDVVSDREFENYLIELTRRKARRMVVFAGKIQDVDALYLQSSSAGFVAILEDVATSIGETLLSEHGLMTYRGSGIFLCVDDGAPKTEERRLQSDINAKLRARVGPDPDVSVKVLVGNRVPLAMRSKLDAIESLSNAVNAVHELDFSTKESLRVPARLVGRRYLTVEQGRLDQRVFAHLLRDTLPTVQDDAWSNKLKKRAQR